MAFDFTSDYDENLMDNGFFQILRKKFSELFLKAVVKNYVICVPKADSFLTCLLTLEDFLAHILVPTEELNESHYSNLRGANIEISSRIITLYCQTGRQNCVRILFQETFYTEDGLKYVVLCIAQPLSDGVALETSNANRTILKNCKDCLDFLSIECGTHETIENIDREVSEFLEKFVIVDVTDLQAITDAVNPLYIKCLKILLKNSNIKKKYKVHKHSFNNLKIAVDTYLQQGIYSKIIKAIKLCTASDDSKLNKIIRNFSDLHFKEFNVNPKFYSNIPKARLELSKFNSHNTTLDKLECLRRTIFFLSEFKLNADDLLQVLSFLIIQTNLPDWNAQLMFLKLFYLSYQSAFDENSYLIASLEAAITFIQNDIFCEQYSHTKTVNNFLENLKDCKEHFLKQAHETAPLKEKNIHQLFYNVALGNLEEVRKIIEVNQSDIKDYNSLNLCHPLCYCDKCTAALKNTHDVPLAINSCDDLGMTALHIASIYNVLNLVDYLLKHGADSNASDYDGRTPAHYAALRGHQNVLLLLLHSNANANSLDNSLNTPLHFSSNNGHENCVKTIIYFSEYSGIKLNLNQCNVSGDTPLHHACKWGYQSIVEILLESGSNPTILNKKKCSPIDYAHNQKILQLLKQKCQKIDYYIKIKPKKPVFDEFKIQINSINKNQIYKGIQPSTPDAKKKVKKTLHAIENGDVHLVCFYMGLEITDFQELDHIVDSIHEGGENSETKCHPLCTCVKCGYLDLETDQKESKTKLPKKNTLNVNICNSSGYTPLHVASKQGNIEMVKGFIRNGASLNIQTSYRLWTPLMLACQYQKIEVVKVLLRAGCEIDMQDYKLNTALHHACSTGNTKLVEALLKYEPKIHLKNLEGKTAMQEAKDKLFFGIMQAIKGDPINDVVDF